MHNESDFDANATSRVGAQGLMQIMPFNYRALSVCDPKDPAQSIIAGTRHLKAQLDHYHGNVPLAVAAYNAGSGAVDQYHGIPPYAETQHYVTAVLRDYAKYRGEAPSAPVRQPRNVPSPRPQARRPVMQVFAEYSIARQNPTNLAVFVK